MDIDRWIIDVCDAAADNPSIALWCFVAWTVLCLGFGSTL